MKNLNVLGFLIWLYDDGHIRFREKIGSEMIICSDSFTTNLKESCKILEDTFNLNKVYIGDRNRIIFDKKSRVRISELILQNIPFSLLKTIPHKYIALLEIMRAGD